MGQEWTRAGPSGSLCSYQLFVGLRWLRSSEMQGPHGRGDLFEGLAILALHDDVQQHLGQVVVQAGAAISRVRT